MALSEKVELLKLIQCGLEHAGVSPRPDLVIAFAEQVKLTASSASIEQWRTADTTPQEIRAIDRWWFHTVLYTALSSLRARASRQRRERITANSVSFFQIKTFGDNCRRSRHAQLEGFAALSNDPVWKIIREPLDWECHCRIQMSDELDLPLDVDPFKPGIERLPLKLLQDCTSWMPRRPKHLLDCSPVPPCPTVETRKWYPSPRKTKEEYEAILNRHGISIKVTFNK